MGRHTRIRWVNVAKLAAGVIGCVALVLGLPALLERPKPPPLPSDIGLAPAADAPPPASLRATRASRPGPEHSRAGKPDREPDPRRRHEGTRPDHHPGPAAPTHRDGDERSDDPEPTPVAAPAAAPSAAPAPAPPPAPAPAHGPPPPPPTPLQTTSSPAPAEPQPSGPAPSREPSEFEFEH